MKSMPHCAGIPARFFTPGLFMALATLLASGCGEPEILSEEPEGAADMSGETSTPASTDPAALAEGTAEYDSAAVAAPVLRYRVNYQSKTTHSSPGTNFLELTTREGGGSSLKVLTDGNGTEFGRHSLPTGYRRAELTANPMATENKTYTYKWAYRVPKGFFNDGMGAGSHWIIGSQWKTYKAGYEAKCTAASATASAATKAASGVCGTGGIFNQMSLQRVSLGAANEPDIYQATFAARAKPYCRTITVGNLETGKWVHFTMQVRWSRYYHGFIRLYVDGTQVFYENPIKTLPTTFVAGACDIKWAMGAYADTPGPRSIDTDSIEIWEGIAAP